MPLLIYRAE